MGGTICPPQEATASTAPGEEARKSRPDHQGNRESPRTHDVGHRAPGNHAEHRAGHHGRLGRPAAEAARQPEGEVDENLARSRRLQQSREQNEDKNELAHDGRDRAQRALGGEPEIGGHPIVALPLEGIGRVIQQAAHIGNQERQQNDRAQPHGRLKAGEAADKLKRNGNAQQDEHDIAPIGVDDDRE